MGKASIIRLRTPEPAVVSADPARARASRAISADVHGRHVEAATRYTGTAMLLHWLAALLVFCGLGLGLYMTGLAFSPAKLRYYAWHKWIGITVFVVAAARLAWRSAHPPPDLPPMPAWQRRAARFTHGALYALMIAIPLSGWLYSSASGVQVVYLGWFALPDLVAKDKVLAAVLKLVHQTLNTALATLVVVHVAATLKHQFADRDGLMARMLPGKAATR